MVLSLPCYREGSHTDLKPQGLLEGGQNARGPTTSLEAVMKVEELLPVMRLRICELGSPN